MASWFALFICNCVLRIRGSWLYLFLSSEDLWPIFSFSLIIYLFLHQRNGITALHTKVSYVWGLNSKYWILAIVCFWVQRTNVQFSLSTNTSVFKLILIKKASRDNPMWLRLLWFVFVLWKKHTNQLLKRDFQIQEPSKRLNLEGLKIWLRYNDFSSLYG